MLRMLMIFVFGLLAMGFYAPPALAETCRENATEVRTNGGTLRLRDYLCDTDEGARIRVQLHRIDDAVAYAALTGTVPDEINEVLGGARVVRNAVSGRFSDLMDQFGELRAFPCLGFDQFAPGNSVFADGLRECDNVKSFKTLGGWRFPGTVNSDINVFPAVEDVRSLFLSNRIPPTYQIDPEYPRSAFRYMTSDDLEGIETKIQQTNDIIRRSDDQVKQVFVPKELEFYRHVTAGRMPKGFAALKALDPGEAACGVSGWTLSYTPRPMMLEVALIQNLSRQQVTISNVLGVKSRSEKLRRNQAAGDIKGGKVTDLSGADVVLRPREKAIVFQRMSLIGHLDQGMELTQFDYGPAEFIRTMSVNSRPVSLDRRSHNATLLTMSTERGSCPFLYVHNGEDWVNHGKVLHDAKGVALKQWDQKRFDGFKGTFRLAELEPELGIIDRAVLDVTLTTGDVVELLPNIDALKEEDNATEDIYMHEYFDMQFKLPVGIEEADVVTSELRVLGYYERYSTMLQTAGYSPTASQEPRVCAVPVPNVSLAERIALAD